MIAIFPALKRYYFCHTNKKVTITIWIGRCRSALYLHLKPAVLTWLHSAPLIVGPQTCWQRLRSVLAAHLSKRYKMKDMGPIDYFLGIKIDREQRHKRVKLSQRAYVERMLKELGMVECSVNSEQGRSLWPSIPLPPSPTLTLPRPETHPRFQD